MDDWTDVPGEGASIALAFVNSLHNGPFGEVDHLSTARELDDWFASRLAARPSPKFSAPDIARVHELRLAVREVLVALPDGRRPRRSALHLLNDVARSAPRSAQLAWSDDTGPHRGWNSAGSRVDSALAAVATDAIELVTGERGELLRTCEAHGCVRLFVREHARRQWCSNGCGDRVRALRHYQRRSHQ